MPRRNPYRKPIAVIVARRQLNAATEAIGNATLWRYPEAVFGGALFLGLCLEVAWPLYFDARFPTLLRLILGLLPLVAGGALVHAAVTGLRRAGQPLLRPQPEATRLVVLGVYSRLRHPLYLGLMLSMLGLGVVFNMPWWILLLFPLAPLVHTMLVLPEERYLEQRFGESYRRYAAAVCRWGCARSLRLPGGLKLPGKASRSED